jgi:hypothetical protein
MALRTFILFLSLSLLAQAGWLKPDVDFSNYDVPLYEVCSFQSSDHKACSSRVIR